MPRRPGREQLRRITDVRDDAEISWVLAIAAHPDDLDFGAAGTIAAWTGAGIDVVYCIVTDGDAGGFDETFPRAEMAPPRRAEQIAAANCVGVHVGYRADSGGAGGPCAPSDRAGAGAVRARAVRARAAPG